METNNFTKDHIMVLAQLLWSNYIDDCNGLSPFWMVIGEPNENEYNGEIYTKGTLIKDPQFLSYAIPATKQLTWKELCLRLDIHTSDIVEDGHNCNICPFEKSCKAYFKYKPLNVQPQCSFWKEKVDNKVYKMNLDKDKIIKDLYRSNINL